MRLLVEKTYDRMKENMKNVTENQKYMRLNSFHSKK